MVHTEHSLRLQRVCTYAQANPEMYCPVVRSTLGRNGSVVATSGKPCQPMNCTRSLLQNLIRCLNEHQQQPTPALPSVGCCPFPHATLHSTLIGVLNPCPSTFSRSQSCPIQTSLSCPSAHSLPSLDNFDRLSEQMNTKCPTHPFYYRPFQNEDVLSSLFAHTV